MAEGHSSTTIGCPSMLRYMAFTTIGVHPSYYPGMALTNVILIESNYLQWSQSIIRGLAAKSKVEFINGSTKIPDKDPELLAWIGT